MGEELQVDAEPQKKKHHVRANLSLVIRLGLTITLLAFAYDKWPEYHYESYQTFWILLYYLSDAEVWIVAANNVRIGLMTYPVTSALELAIVTVAIWKFIRNGYVVALFRLKSMAMIILSGFVVWLLYFRLLHIQETDLFIRYVEDILFARSSIKILLYPIGYDNALFVYSMLIIYLVGYLVVKAGVALMSHTRYPKERLSKEELDELGITEVLMSVNPLRRMILPRPRFYVCSVIGDNAHCEGRNIVIGTQLIEYGEEVVQGIVAHELGHYYHYDMAATIVNSIAIGAMLLTFNLGALAVQLIGCLYALLPGFFARIITLVASTLAMVVLRISAILTTLIGYVFWLVDGKWAERAADIFAVNLGYGKGLYLYLFDISNREHGFSLEYLFDEHPLVRTRLGYVRRRIKMVWGKEVWGEIDKKADEISEAYRIQWREEILKRRLDRG